MLFKQFYLESLGHASYFIAAEESGEALVLDVRRDVDGYLRTAREHGMALCYACDTHQHNDYVTGICELPQRGEVQLLAGARAQLRYPVRPMADGERLRMGELEIEFMHTPGHTPEHISLLVTDHSRGPDPALLFSGGALLVADVARPDLLGGEEATRAGAESLCRTLREKILPLPDHVEVYPTHVAGSLCGGSIGSRLSTTIGYERRLNRLLASIASREEFVAQCMDLTALPAVPPYWRRMRKLNQDGPPPLGVLTEPPPLAPAQFEERRRQGVWVLDCRSPEAFAMHIPGALNVPAGNAFPTWAGTVLPPGQTYQLVLEEPGMLWEVCWQLLRIGYDLPQGWLAGGMLAWRTSGRELAFMSQWSVQELARQREQERGLIVLDVRQPAEWQAGHVPGALHLTGAEVPARLDELPKDRPLAVICGSGYRSGVAASLLRREGYPRVHNVLGGMAAWRNAGLPVTDGAGD